MLFSQLRSRSRLWDVDYSARRSGGDEENQRRASRTSREFQAPLDQPGYQNGSGPQRSEGMIALVSAAATHTCTLA